MENAAFNLKFNIILYFSTTVIYAHYAVQLNDLFVIFDIIIMIWKSHVHNFMRVHICTISYVLILILRTLQYEMHWHTEIWGETLRKKLKQTSCGKFFFHQIASIHSFMRFVLIAAVYPFKNETTLVLMFSPPLMCTTIQCSCSINTNVLKIVEESLVYWKFE